MGFFPNTGNQGVSGALTVTGGASISGGLTLPTGNLTVSSGSYNGGSVLIAGGDLDCQTAGRGLRIAEGSNAKQGTATLAAGTVVVANTSVTATSRIVCGLVSLGTVTTPSALGVSARTAGTSFTILASQATDTSVVWYEIFEAG